MACADAIWRIFIFPKGSRNDENSLLQLLGVIRPKETRKFSSLGGPGFRRMHEVIQHVGTASRLDCWRLEARDTIDSLIASLDDFAKLEPSWETLVRMAKSLCIKYVPGQDTLPDLRRMADKSRDKVHENTLLQHQIFLLYEEITHAMNYGDIGRLEHAFPAWSMIFAGCGKHKYSAELMRYLTDVHFRYPPGLKYGVRKAVRYNILINPTGKEGHWRGIDWLVEHNNLYMKQIYSGKFSNHQIDHIINESPLIEVYKNNRRQLEKMFCLARKGTKHASPDMTSTYKKLSAYMAEKKTNERVPSRSAKYVVTNAMEKGMEMVRERRGGRTGGDPVKDQWDGLPEETEIGEDDGDLEDLV
ncbi:hypothetical protein NP233_g11098 [Leucocoprinus birnbaumii]|uniref:DUF6589 domain-containing protein n=1 Tax=Leucocoprinus birnbaumii TaxID=56174 RepID=A0AAD5YP95_9AGAR|nr:hypothetical protein NP233_g11098 [Leucocoprinus birnbaumii]